MDRRGEHPWRVNRARVLRSNSTAAEDRLWSELRAKRLGGFKFVRQMPIGPYFADFACRSAMLIVEVDGATHSTTSEVDHDSSRTGTLQASGYRVFRVHNNEIYDNLDGVLDSLLAVLMGRTDLTDQGR